MCADSRMPARSPVRQGVRVSLRVTIYDMHMVLVIGMRLIEVPSWSTHGHTPRHYRVPRTVCTRLQTVFERIELC
jgi:hypothetical protein